MEKGSSETDGELGSVNSIISSLMERTEEGKRDEATNLELSIPSTSSPIADSQIAQGSHCDTGTRTSGNQTTVSGTSTRLHPMETPPILTHFFSICPPQILAVARQVSSQWRDLSLPSCRSAFKIKFHYRNLLEDNDFEIIFATKIAPLSEFLKYVEDPGNEFDAFPYRKLKLEYWPLFTGTELIGKFWRLIGSNLTSLELFECDFPDADEFRKIIFQRCPLLRNLIVVLPYPLHGQRFVDINDVPSVLQEYKDPIYGEHVHMKYLTVKMSYRRFAKRLPISWTELLSHSQSLTTIKVALRGAGNFGRTVQKECDRVLQAVRNIRQHSNGKKLPLKEFYFDPAFNIARDGTTHEEFALARELRLPLKSLRIELDEHECMEPISGITEILEFHAGTLENIMVKGSYLPFELFPQRCRFLIMLEVELGKLEKLRISHAFYESIGILKHSPNLKELSINMCNQTVFELGAEATFQPWGMEPSDINFVNLVKLYLGFSTVTDFELITMMKWAPNLEYLEMILDDRMFGIVCGQWKSLRELVVRGGVLSDKGITGMSSAEWEGLRGNRFDDRELPPNITNLQGLTKFGCDSRLLTDKSVFHGFRHLPKLQRITNCSITPSAQFGKKAMKVLQRKKNEVLCESITNL